MPRPDVDEVDLHPVDLCPELRQRVQSRLALAPVVVARPVAGQLLQRRQLHALRSIRDQLLAGPARRRDAPAQLGEFLFGNLDLERTYVDGRFGSTHVDLGSGGRGRRPLLWSGTVVTLLLPSNEWHQIRHLGRSALVAPRAGLWRVLFGVSTLVRAGKTNRHTMAPNRPNCCARRFRSCQLVCHTARLGECAFDCTGPRCRRCSCPVAVVVRCGVVAHG